MSTKTQKNAREAQLRRSQQKNKVDNTKQQYYYVIGGFCVIMAGAATFTILNPQQSFAQMPIVDETSILVHNGQSHRFLQGANDFFGNWTIADAKQLFEQGLSDTQNIEQCRSGTVTDKPVPESYDWRQVHPDCKRESAPMIDKNCASSYVHTALSAVEDRICASSKQKVTLSAEEILDCDKTSNGCKGGTMNRVLAWGKRKGFTPQECYSRDEQVEGEESKYECTAETLQENECRQNNNIYKVVDFCLASEVEGVKREIMTNGPVLGQLNPHTDFLTYASGSYQRTPEAFKYNGNHVVKIMGWEQTPDGASAWIIENSWGSSWGEDGYGYVVSNGETQLDYFGLGLAVYPTSMADYYAQQQASQSQEFSFTMPDDPEAGQTINLDDHINFNLDDEAEAQEESGEPKIVEEFDEEL